MTLQSSVLGFLLSTVLALQLCSIQPDKVRLSICTAGTWRKLYLNKPGGIHHLNVSKSQYSAILTSGSTKEQKASPVLFFEKQNLTLKENYHL